MTIGRLVGFVRDTVGLENAVFEASPVITIQDDTISKPGLYVAPGLDWTRSNLKPAHGHDIAFVSRLGFGLPINEGESVWLAGPGFVRSLRGALHGSPRALEVGAWQTSRGGFRLTVGPRARFLELTNAISQQATKRLHRALFDALEKNLGDARELFAIIDSCPSSSPQELAITRGVYYLETLDYANYEWTQDEAVTFDRIYRDAAQFDEAVERRRVWMREQRLSDASDVHDVSLTDNVRQAFWNEVVSRAVKQPVVVRSRQSNPPANGTLRKYPYSLDVIDGAVA